MWIDNHGRPLTYVRIAVTDRCNLRCFYCMPEEGIRYLPKKDLLTFEEIERLVTVMASQGISKVRFTGGEPFVRKDFIDLLGAVSQIQGVTDIHLTTNGVLTAPHIKNLKAAGVKSVNLSLDSLDRQRFKQITRRDEFDRVMDTFYQLLENNIRLKINAVVMDGQNIDDIIPLVELTRIYPVSVRFIEEMPFNGTGSHQPTPMWTYKKIIEHIRMHYPSLTKLEDEAHTTSYNYSINGHAGHVGVIAAFSRTFCGSCNRIRITAQGMLKTCLYDDGVLNVRDLLRTNITDEELLAVLGKAFRHRAKDGFEAERQRKENNPVTESMSTIGG